MLEELQLDKPYDPVREGLCCDASLSYGWTKALNNPLRTEALEEMLDEIIG